jgi:hypothetical protein
MMAPHPNATFRALSILSLVALAGCGLLSKKGSGEAHPAEAGVAEVDAGAAVPAPPASVAANADGVSRFADETPVDKVAATLQRTANVREIPGVGKIVATLTKGAAVTELAQRGTAFLVLFDKDHVKLMGWVGQEVFTPASVVSTTAITCKAPEVSLITDGPFCGLVCTGSSGCPTGQACKGTANRLSKGKVGDAVSVCSATSIVRPVAANVSPAVPTPAASGSAAVTRGTSPASAAAPPTPTPAPQPAANLDDLPPKERLFAICEQQAGDRKGQDRKEFIVSCHAGGPMTPERLKMQNCNKESGNKKGEDRKIFMKACLAR